MEIPHKLKLYIKYISKSPIEKCKFPLLINLSEIEEIMGQKNQDIMKMKNIYFNKRNVHEILYKEEETIYFSPHIIKQNKLGNLFYLNLLILDDINIVNYKYKFDLINQLNEYNKMNKPLQKILYSMIIIVLIDNYRGFIEENDEIKNKVKIDSIENFNINMIEENIFNIKNYNLEIIVNDYKNNKIDQIYAQIINQIISNYKLENINDIYEILEQLEIEKIDINNCIFYELLQDLDIKNSFINDIKIENKNDFLNIKKLNFYYILLKYILKNSIYIYQIPFLVETRKIIINIIKNDNLKFLNKDNKFNNYSNILFFIIKTLTDSEYYFKIFELNLKGLKKNNNEKKREYEENNNEKKGEYEENNNEKKGEYEENIKINNDLTTMITYNNFNSLSLENDIINFVKKKRQQFSIIYYSKNYDKNKNIDLINSKINEDKITDDNPECINSHKILNFIEEFDEIIKRKAGNKFNSQILLTLKEEDKKNKNNIYNLTCEYYYEKLKTNYRDENILINGLNQGFQALLCDIIYE